MIQKFLEWLKHLFVASERHAQLRQYPLFKDLNAHQLQLVDNCLHAREFKAGETLYEAGFPLEVLYFVAEGELKVGGANPNAGFQVMKKHDCVGVADLFAKGKRSGTAIALTDLSLLALSQSDFWDLVNKNSALGVKVLSACGRILGRQIADNAPHSQA